LFGPRYRLELRLKVFGSYACNIIITLILAAI
jgi:hypothetical protein